MKAGVLLWWPTCVWDIFTIVYCNTIVCASLHPHIISLSRRDQDKPPSHTEVHVGRMNNGYVAWTPAELQLCLMEIYSKRPSYILVLMWPFIHPLFCVCRIWVCRSADTLTQELLCSTSWPLWSNDLHVHLMRLDKPTCADRRPGRKMTVVNA